MARSLTGPRAYALTEKGYRYTDLMRAGVIAVPGPEAPDRVPGRKPGADRAPCPWCSQVYVLLDDGRLPYHSKRGKDHCRGSRKTPARAARDAAAHDAEQQVKP
ncbi:hypothetical protein [Catellatospora sp. NPDC049609]|uniref:hypothetical protein n=1 Tax=Catellatospora sp. NPDC049609 TaxID=3155505 RepID=UPI003424F5B8